MEKVLNYILSPDSVYPEETLCAGFQGEHKATSLVFTPDESLRGKIDSAVNMGYTLVSVIDAVTESGDFFKGNERTAEELFAPFYLTNSMTCSGLGLVVVFRLILKGKDEDIKEFYKAQIKLCFEESPLPVFAGGTEKNEEELLEAKAEEIYGMLDEKAQRIQEIMEYKLDTVKEQASASAGQLKKVIAIADELGNTKNSLNDIEFVFIGGDSLHKASPDLIVDDELSEYSQNPVQNKVITEAINKAKKDLILEAHPIGSVYFSAEDINPTLLFGGNWEKVNNQIPFFEEYYCWKRIG